METKNPDQKQLTKEEEARLLLHDEADLEDTKCGLGLFKPNWLQRLAKKETYIVVFCMVGLTQGIYFTYMVSVISTIEKRFKFTSKETGTILSGNDLSQIILSIVLGYYGNYGNRPRWMGIGVMCAALSGFAAALPHFIYGPGKDAIAVARAAASGDTLLQNLTALSAETKKEELCFFQPEEICGEDGGGAGGGESYLGPIILFFVSQFLFGVTLSIFYSLGITYLDDNISKKVYPIYYSITFMLRILGPVLGFFVGGKCLSVWIDPSIQPNISRRDPRWFGAWWIGFLFIGFALLFSGSFLFLFPRKLPTTLKREAKRAARLAEKEEKAGGKRRVEFFASLAKSQRQEEKPNMKSLGKALKRLFTNKIWVGNLFNTSVYLLGVAGYWNFKPKYLETQFRQSATTASYYTGMASLVSLVFGTGLGGVILRFAKPGPRFVTGYNIFITLLMCCSYIILSFIGCPKLQVVGPVGKWEATACSADCGCTDKFSPVCGEDQTTLFYSACYAGCSSINVTASPIEYSDCRCIVNKTTSPPDHALHPAASPHQDNLVNLTAAIPALGSGRSGYCPEPCGMFFYYIIIQMVIKTVASTGRVGSSLIHLRSVADEDKGIALGTLNVFLSVFAFIPAPIVFGAIIDSACLVWDNSCGKSGNCWLYDTDKFRLIIHLVPAAFIFVSVFGDLVVFYYSRQLDLYGEKEEDMMLEKTRAAMEEVQPSTHEQVDGDVFL
ncbi:solute carrier organic anion transporter family member 74D-like [Panulirus ornatus]|uniref:solute carrier organic anion transporter family member 74D-like n=1 Tax=Panulirus ornatus TaxID=150431 RepID=UPI003A8C5650